MLVVSKIETEGSKGNCNMCVRAPGTVKMEIGDPHYPFNIRLCNSCFLELQRQMSEIKLDEVK